MPFRHLALGALVATIWGVNFVVVDVGLREVPPLLFAALRFALVAVPGVFLVGRPGTGVRWVVLIGLLLGVGQFGLLFVAMDQGMPAGLASVVLQTQALFTVVFAVALLRERLTPRRITGVVVAAAGLGIIAAGRSAGVPLVPLLVVLVAAASWGAANIATRVARPSNGLRLIVWASLVPPVPLVLLSLLFEGYDADRRALAHFSWVAAGAVAYLAVLATIVGFGVWSTLLRRYSASVVAPLSLLVPVVGIAAAWVALGEVPTSGELVGAAVVLVGLLVLNSRRRAVDLRMHTV